MSTANRVFRSGDPLDQLSDPLDQPNEKGQMRAPLEDASENIFEPEPEATLLRPVEVRAVRLVLLHVIRDNPRSVLLAARKARLVYPGRVGAIKPDESMRAPPGFGYRDPPIRRRGPRRPRNP